MSNVVELERAELPIVRLLIACPVCLVLAVACATSSAGVQTHPSPSADPVQAFRAKLLSDAPGFLNGIGGCTHLQDPPATQQGDVKTYCTNIVTHAAQSVEQLLTDLQPGAVPSALAPKADTVRSQLQAYLVILQKDQVAIAAGRWNDVIANQQAADQAGDVARRSIDDLANCTGC